MRRLTKVFLILLCFGLFSEAAFARTVRLSQEEEELFELIKSNRLQKRKKMQLDPILCKLARARAKDMGRRNYFGHVNPDGMGPNFLATKAGYILPAFYDSLPEANNIESIAARSPKGTPKDGMKQWLHSPEHKKHTMGLTLFARSQTRIGVGIAQFKRGARFNTYYVFISAPGNRNPNPPRVTLKDSLRKVIARTR